ncbi:MAG: lysophospholipid acyltransferase family protein [Monoglobales bacterium]
MIYGAIYKIVTGFMSFWYKFWFGAKISGLENIPQEGGCIVCGNHISNHDAVFVASYFPRRCTFLAKKELFIPVIRGILKKVGAIPVKRGATDVGAIKASIRALKDEKPLVLFPQGTRLKKLEFDDFKNGAPFLAIKCNVPIIPVGICGKFKFRSGIKLKFGSPIHPQDYNYDSNEVSTVLYKTIESMVNDG